MSARISVVIPTYNGVKYIAEALGSVLSQTLRPLEVIVVDDRSTDGTVDVVALMGRTASLPIKVIELPTNSGGPAKPMNVGVQASQGEFVALLDQDDRMAPEKLELAARLLGQHPSTGIFFGQMELMNRDGTIVPRAVRYSRYPRECALMPAAEALRDLLVGYMYGGAGGTAVRKAAWDDVGGFREHLCVAWDYDFALRATLGGWDVSYAPHTVYYHRQHEENLERADGGLPAVREVADVLMGCLQSPQLPKRHWLLAASAVREALATAAYRHRTQRQYGQAVKCYCGAVRIAIRTGRPASIWDPLVGLFKLGAVYTCTLVRAAKGSG